MSRKSPVPLEILGSISVPRHVMAEVRLLLLDPLGKRVKWGSLSRLIASLLEEWVAKQRRTGGTEAQILRQTGYLEQEQRKQ